MDRKNKSKITPRIWAQQNLFNFALGLLFSFSIFAFLFPEFSQAQESNDYIYVVQNGDSLGRILKALRLGPIYGEKGSLTNYLNCHPDLASRHGDYILPGQRMAFHLALHPVTEKYVSINQDKEIEINQKKFKQFETENKINPNLRAEARPLPGSGENICSILNSLERSPAQEAEYKAVAPPNENALLTPTVNSGPANSRGEMRLGPSFGYFRIDENQNALGTTMSLLSNLNYGIDASWVFHWSENWSSLVGLELQNVNVSPSNQKYILSQNQNLATIKMGALYQNEKLQYRLLLKYGDDLMGRLVNGVTQVQVEIIPAASLEGEFRYDLLSNDPMKLGFSVTGISDMAISSNYYNSAGGSGFRVGPSMTRSGPNFDLEGGVFYGQTNLPLNGFSYLRTDIILNFSLSWKLK